MNGDVLLYANKKILHPEDWVVDFTFEGGKTQRLYVFPKASQERAVWSATALATHMFGGTLPTVVDIKTHRRHQIDPHFRKTQVQDLQGS